MRRAATRTALMALLLAFAVGACGGTTDTTEAALSESPTPTSSVAPRADDAAAGDSSRALEPNRATRGPQRDVGRQLSPLAELVRPAPDILYDPLELAADVGPAPARLTIGRLGVVDAVVRDVGVEASGEMEIPGATEVGWYRWSPTPGSMGSAVLAAHIAYNGRDGVFRDLDDLEIGDEFVVHYDDETSRAFRVTERAQYDKQELPFDRVFARDGRPTVVLITCGGDFDGDRSSYEDNVVAYAEPV